MDVTTTPMPPDVKTTTGATTGPVDVKTTTTQKPGSIDVKTTTTQKPGSVDVKTTTQRPITTTVRASTPPPVDYAALGQKIASLVKANAATGGLTVLPTLSAYLTTVPGLSGVDKNNVLSLTSQLVTLATTTVKAGLISPNSVGLFRDALNKALPLIAKNLGK